MPAKEKEIAQFIDHTLLKPHATKAEIEKLCQEALDHGFKGVCVNPAFVDLVAQLLKGQNILPIAVVGFPLGASQSSTKAFEAKEAVSAGAKEIDMVINISALKAKDYKVVFKDMSAVIEECVVRKLVDPKPCDRLVRLPALAHRCELRRLGADQRVATHAGLRRRHHRFAGTLDLGVAVATVQAELAGV